jgi:hypothetical protein
MFDSEDRLERAGFEVLKGWKPGNIIVFTHPNASDVIFKKYANDKSPDDQLDNYRERLRGAEALGNFIAARQLKHILVPQKHLHELPASFSFKKKSPSYVLICERMSILPKKQNKALYQDAIDADVLRDLCAVVSKFRGLDSGSYNMPFTTSGQIAFIDTENWSGHQDRKKFEKIEKLLSKRSLKLAKSFFDELDSP